MTQGLQTFGTEGELILDVTNRLTKQTVQMTTASGVSGSITIPGVTSGSKPFYMALYSPQPPYTSIPPAFSLNMTTGLLSWSGGNMALDFVAGIY